MTFPNGEAEYLLLGSGGETTRAVVETFAPRFLADPGLLWIGGGGQRFTRYYLNLARHVGLALDTLDAPPDVILVDLAAPDPPLFVFVEVVASDGPVTEERREALLALVRAGGHAEANAAFVTAYWDRDRPAYRKTVGSVAWHTFVWCATEADKIVVHRDGARAPARLADLLPPGPPPSG